MKSWLRILIVFLSVWTISRSAVLLLPGDPAEFLVHESLVRIDVPELRARMQLDRPAWSRILSAPGGRSLTRNESSTALVARATTQSLLLTALTLAFALPATFFLLFLRFSGARARTLSSIFALVLGSTPLILSGSLLLRYFSFPNPLLPAIALSLHLTAFWQRALSRQLDRRLPFSSMQGGRARGFTESRVFLRDLLAPALGSFIAYFGTQIGVLLNGSLLIEVLFQWNGLGSLIAESVLSRDYPVLDAAILAAALLTLFCQQLGYSFQKWWDPEIS